MAPTIHEMFTNNKHDVCFNHKMFSINSMFMNTNKQKQQIFERICATLADKGISKPAFQDSLGIKSQHWNNWKNRGVPAKDYARIADRLGVTIDWLSTGQGEQYKITDKQQEIGLCLAGQLKTIELGIAAVPLIDFNNAGSWKEELRNHTPGKGELMITGKFGKNVFAVCITSDSMQPGVNKGEIVLIDPDRRAVHENYILVEYNGDIVLRQYWREAGQWYLKPLNDRYNMTAFDGTGFIGVAIKKHTTQDLV